jgi:hypothetical protein
LKTKTTYQKQKNYLSGKNSVLRVNVILALLSVGVLTLTPTLAFASTTDHVDTKSNKIEQKQKVKK